MFFAAMLSLLFMKLAAQNSNVVLYTENGERFYAIMNGQRMNDEPVTNLKVQDLNQPAYQLKVIFENKNLGEMNKNLYLEENVEAVYAVKMDKKGSYKLAFRSSVPIAQAAPPAPQQQIVVWGAPAPVAQNVQPAPAATTTTTVVEETVTTTTNANGNGMSTNVTTPDGENVSMNVSADGFGFNMNIQTGSNTGTQTVAGSSTVTTTTTTTTTSSPAPAVVAEPVYEPAPCSMLNNSDFEAAKGSIKGKTFEDSKLTTAKQVTKANCLSAAQIKSIMDLFTYESSKLEYAKFAYPFCYEQNKYYQVNDAFGFESSIDELDEFLQSQR